MLFRMPPRAWLVSILVTLTIALGALSIGVAAQGPDTCGYREASARVIVNTSVPNGAAVYDHIPGLKKAPFLESMAGPLRVVAFQGKISVPVLGMLSSGVTTPTEYNNVVCVETATGDRTYFAEVDLDIVRP